MSQKTIRRTFLKNLTRAGLLGAIAPAVPQLATSKGNNEEPEIQLLTQPYLQFFAPDKMVVRWITNRPAFSWVAFGVVGETLSKKALPQERNGLIDADTTVHCVVIEGLKPGQPYQYQAVSKCIGSFRSYPLYDNTISSEVFSFTMPDLKSDQVSFLVLNDTHDRPESIGHLIGLNKDNPYDFVFFNGDIFTFVHNEPQIIDHFIQPVTHTFGTTKPFMFVRGNHETRGRHARHFDRYFLTDTTQFYSTFEWGPLFTLVIDTGEDKVDSHTEYAGVVDFDAYRERQALWASKVMESRGFRKAKYRLVLMHIPHFNSDEKHGTTHVRKLFHPLFEKHKVDMVICGHTHKYGVHPPDKDHSYPIIIGGGPQDGNRTLIRVTANNEQLRVNMLDDEGVEVGQYTVKG